MQTKQAQSIRKLTTAGVLAAAIVLLTTLVSIPIPGGLGYVNLGDMGVLLAGMNYIADDFKKNNGIDLRQDKMALQRLKEAAEKAKIDLSGVAQTTINLPFITMDKSGPKHLDITLTRAKFNELINDYVEQTKTLVQKCLSDAGLSAAQVDKVILVGGSSRIPVVQDMARTFAKLLTSAFAETGCKTALLSGGVSGSLLLRELLQQRLKSELFYAESGLSSDNAVGTALFAMELHQRSLR